MLRAVFTPSGSCLCIPCNNTLAAEGHGFLRVLPKPELTVDEIANNGPQGRPDYHRTECDRCGEIAWIDREDVAACQNFVKYAQTVLDGAGFHLSQTGGMMVAAESDDVYDRNGRRIRVMVTLDEDCDLTGALLVGFYPAPTDPDDDSWCEPCEEWPYVGGLLEHDAAVEVSKVLAGHGVLDRDECEVCGDDCIDDDRYGVVICPSCAESFDDDFARSYGPGAEVDRLRAELRRR